MPNSLRLRAVVRGTGSALPARVVTNDELARTVDTSDEWIVQRTGIRQRRVSSPEETTGSLAIEASRRALEAANMEAEAIDLIVLATISGDYPWPATACAVQDALGAKNAGAYDLSAACAGFVYALASASAMIESGAIRRALVVGADCLTKQLDWSDRATCILFGDAAGACVLEAEEGTDRGVMRSVLLSDGSGTKHLLVEGGGGKHPHGSGARETIFMAGKEVYRFAVSAMGDACERVLQQASMSADEVDLFVPHQANVRIIDSAAKRLGLPEEKVYVNVDRYANTSGASIPLALDEAARNGRLKPGMLALTVGFGGGLVWGANLIRW